MNPQNEREFTPADFEPTKRYRIAGWSADGLPLIVEVPND